MSVDNQDLHKLILQLTERVKRLEKMVQSNPITDIPEMNFTKWIENCIVTSEDVEMVYENNGYREAIRNCISRNHTISPLPIIRHKNRLYIYETDNWEKWDNSTHLHVLVRDIWRKFIKSHMNATPDPMLEEEMRDLQRKRILEMRQKLYEVKKNRAELYQWLHKIDS
jgi:hypothetical protein